MGVLYCPAYSPVEPSLGDCLWMAYGLPIGCLLIAYLLPMPMPWAGPWHGHRQPIGNQYNPTSANWTHYLIVTCICGGWRGYYIALPIEYLRQLNTLLNRALYCHAYSPWWPFMVGIPLGGGRPPRCLGEGGVPETGSLMNNQNKQRNREPDKTQKQRSD